MARETARTRLCPNLDHGKYSPILRKKSMDIAQKFLKTKKTVIFVTNYAIPPYRQTRRPDFARHC